MPTFADCSTNIATLTPAQFCGGFGGCGNDGLLATSDNLNAIMQAVHQSTTIASYNYDDSTNLLTITYVDGSTFAIDFTAIIADAVAGATLPAGAIILWAGAAIPTGWALCDGAGSTPDLRDRFVIGSGGAYATGATGGTDTHGHTATADNSVTGISLTTTVNPNIDAGGSANPDPIDSVSVNDPGHVHTVTVADATYLPPYYALAYIIKL